MKKFGLSEFEVILMQAGVEDILTTDNYNEDYAVQLSISVMDIRSLAELLKTRKNEIICEECGTIKTFKLPRFCRHKCYLKSLENKAGESYE